MAQKFNIFNKKAQGHIEIIISFVIFLGFVIFLLFILNPINRERVSNVIFDETWADIQNNLSINYEKVSLVLDSGVLNKLNSKDCFYISEVPYNLTNTLVLNSQNQPVVSSTKVSENQISITKIAGELLYGIYFSGEFNNLAHSGVLSGCKEIKKSDKDYDFGILNNETKILYENLLLFNQSYVSNYLQLKKYLGIKNEFEFIVYNETREVMSDVTYLNKIKSNAVLSREIPITVINKEAQKIKLIINLRVWE